MVAEISPTSFFMTADGNYTPKAFGGGPIQQFQDVKGTCVLTMPRIEPWHTDFQHAIASLQWLEQQKLMAGTQRQGLFKDEKKTMPKIVHKFFSVSNHLYHRTPHLPYFRIEVIMSLPCGNKNIV